MAEGQKAESAGQSGRTKVTTVRLPDDIAQTLDLVARVDGHSVSAIIVAAVQRYLNERTVTRDFRVKAAALIGRERALMEGLRSPITTALDVPDSVPERRIPPGSAEEVDRG